MYYRSTLVAVTMIFVQTTFAFEASPLSFEQQENKYLSQIEYAPSFLLDTPLETPQSGFGLNEDEPLQKHLSTFPEKNWDYLIGQTYTIFGLSVATVGLMTFLPESITNWTSEDRDFSNLANKWWDNVSSGPIWDKDDHYLNYVMHPYFGGVYYTAARHAGFDEFESFLYSLTMSTFFWEYGVESFAEIPSIQDIIITPLFGAAMGEWMYIVEQGIIENDSEVLGSSSLGNVSLFFLNPVGHIHSWVSNLWGSDTEVSMSYVPWFTHHEAAEFAIDSGADYDSQFIGMEISLKF